MKKSLLIMKKSQLRQLAKHFNTGNLTNFAMDIENMIREFGITEFARRSGLCRISLWRYMKGSDIRISTLFLLLNTLGISVRFEADRKWHPSDDEPFLKKNTNKTEECEYITREI